MDNPCYGCQERHAGCHAECEDYQSWAAVRAEERRMRDLAFRGEPAKQMRSQYVIQAQKQFKRKGRF